MYTKKTYRIGEYVEIIKSYPGNQKPGPRGRRERPTEEAMERYNQHRKEKKVQRLILANFGPGDFHMTLSYAKELRPENMEEAKKNIRNFFRTLKRRYKKLGRELKYIAVTERGSLGACHHHVIINGTPELVDLVREIWKFGHEDYKPLYAEGAYEKLAQYIVKKEGKEEEQGTSYTASRNLIVPQPKVERIGALVWRPEPKIPAGYELVRDSLVNSVNPVNGRPRQEYMLKRTEKGGSGCRKRKR